MADQAASPSKSSVATEAIGVVCAMNLHQSLWLPKTNSHERLRVTFATTSNFADNKLPVLLFCGPMFASRWMALDMNHLAAKNSVRVICVDRPGMGGSTRVPLKIRVQVWLETVPVLLEKLKVEHVSLFCHSTGAIFALNTIYQYPGILDPRSPYVAFMAPWVNHKQPHTVLMNAVSKIPNGLLGYWHSVIKFTQQRVAPITSWSGGVVSSLMDSANSDSVTFVDKYGMTEEAGKEIERLKMAYIFEEDITGADEDARLCLRKEGPGCWGVCEDYFEFVQNFTKLEQERTQSLPTQNKLRVDAYFAASDVMIGKDGQDHFEKSWRQDGVDECIIFENQVLDETSHDSILGDPKKGALERIFKHVSSSMMEDTKISGE